MGKVIVTDTYLSNIASAIRGKAGTQSLYTPAQMASAIANLPSGVSVSALSVSANGTYSAPSGYAYDPVTVDVQGGGGGGNEDAIIERTLSGTYTNTTASIIGNYAFADCNLLKEVNIPNVTKVYSSAFYSCALLETVHASNLTTVSDYAFAVCEKLITVDAPLLSSVGKSAFYNCLSLTNIITSSLKRIESCAFQNCNALESINVENVVVLQNTAFSGATKLSRLHFKTFNSVVGNYAFANCYSLQSVRFDSRITLSGSAFQQCRHLIGLYLLSSSVCSLKASNNFSNTPIAGNTASTGGVYGSIYVRASLYSTYIASTNWSYFSSRFVSLTDEQIAALDAQQ